MNNKIANFDFHQVEGDHCVWYDVCKTESYGSKSIYCSYNGTAKKLDSTGVDLLNTYCPHLNQGAENTHTCCNNRQVRLKNYLKFDKHSAFEQTFFFKLFLNRLR